MAVPLIVSGAPCHACQDLRHWWNRRGVGVRRVHGARDHESIGYLVVGGEAVPRALLIEPVEKSWRPDYRRFGLGLASDFPGDGQFNLLVQYRETWINRLGPEWVTEAQIGEDNRLSTELSQVPNSGASVGQAS